MTAVFPSSTHLRTLNPRLDLAQVADLVELCFANNMDEDGRLYIRQMRRVANEARYLRVTSVRLEGFVWEEGGRIIGNITLIPFQLKRGLIYLAANIATHPDYRRRGIGERLTEAGVRYARDRGAVACWLQVRDDNFGAYQLYQAQGFLERTRRTTWHWQPSTRINPPADNGVEVTRRQRRDWSKQLNWLLRVYPDTVRWNLPFDPNRLKPGLWSSLIRLFSGEPQAHWAARLNHQLIGVASWEPTRLAADTIWLATGDGSEDLAIRSLLPFTCRNLRSRRPLTVNYPAGRATQAFFEAGFNPHYSLIWMEIPFH
jgi:ribosomal protein S18 acetylase RimI-like enzyme